MMLADWIVLFFRLETGCSAADRSAGQYYKLFECL